MRLLLYFTDKKLSLKFNQLVPSNSHRVVLVPHSGPPQSPYSVSQKAILDSEEAAGGAEELMCFELASWRRL